MDSPSRPDLAAISATYPVRALVLQGGGALGAYQAGVYQGLTEAGIETNWVAGISIGALNAALIAGNAPQRRADALRSFWETICTPPWAPATTDMFAAGREAIPAPVRAAIDSMNAARAVLEGQNGFFVPRPWYALGAGSQGPQAVSVYDTTPLRSTLERLVDFDRINARGEMRVSVGAVNVRSGNFVYFDSHQRKLGPEHFMASGALPPGFPAVEVDGDFYWDGGLVSNTPLQYVLNTPPRRDALIFQVDLWSAAGEAPRDLVQVATRQKEIQYSSRTRAVTTHMQEDQTYRRMIHRLLELVPESARDSGTVRMAQGLACNARRNVVHLIYRNKPYEGYCRDYEFGRISMSDHWNAGFADIGATLLHAHWLEKPGEDEPFVTHDVHRAKRPG